MTEPAGASQLLTADELADRWQIPKSHVYRLTREGRLPTVRLGRYCRYRLVDLEQFEINGGTQNTTERTTTASV